MTVHTPAFYCELGTTLGTSYMLIPQSIQLVAVELSRAWHHHGSHMAMAVVRMVTHPSINLVHDYLTLVVNHEMLTPSYQGNLVNAYPQCLIQLPILGNS